MTGLLADLEQGNARGGAMVTVVAAQGSTPRGPGAYMIVGPEGARVSGTIGGGALEYEALKRVGAMLANGEPAALVDVPLGPELGQCCGGFVSLLFEPLPVAIAMRSDVANPAVVTDLVAPFRRHIEEDRTGALRGCVLDSGGGRVRDVGGKRVLIQPTGQPRQPLAVFGAGHVGTAIVRAMAALPFAVRWIDNRADLLDGFAGVGNVEPVFTASPEDQVAHLAPGCFVLIMTQSHALDFEILRRALGRSDLGYVGLIGSMTKRAKFIKKLKAYAIGDSAIDNLVCPIGLPAISGKEPAVIAASVAAELLVHAEQMAAGSARASALRAVS